MTRLLVALSLTVTLLVACSSRPDDAAVTHAVQEQVQSSLANVDELAGRLGGDSAVKILRAFGTPDPKDVSVAHLDVLESERLAGGDYTMKVHYDLVTPNDSRGVMRTIQLRKTGDGWQAVDYDPANPSH